MGGLGGHFWRRGIWAIDSHKITGVGVYPAFLWNFVSRLQLPSKLGPVTELLRGRGPQHSTGARGPAMSIFGQFLA